MLSQKRRVKPKQKFNAAQAKAELTALAEWNRQLRKQVYELSRKLRQARESRDNYRAVAIACGGLHMIHERLGKVKSNGGAA